MVPQNQNSFKLLKELTALIEETKTKISVQINSSLTLLFWQIGHSIFEHILHNQRAEYGKQIVVTLSRELVNKFGRIYEEKNLRRMIQFAEEFPDYENVVTLSRQLSWSHFLTLIPIKNKDARNYYAKLASDNLIGVRALRKQISSKAYERTENANIQLSKNNTIEKDIFKDPYFLDFLN